MSEIQITGIDSVTGQQKLMNTGDTLINIIQHSLAPTATQTITSGCCAVLSDKYEIVDGVDLEIQDTAIFEIT